MPYNIKVNGALMPAIGNAVFAATDQRLRRLPVDAAQLAQGSARMVGLGTLVGVIDDDESVRESLPDLLRELGYAVRAFASAEEFLACDSIAETGCLILDIAMPGMTGPELQRELVRRGQGIPVIFITALSEKRTSFLYPDTVACLLKPFSEEELRIALSAAVPRPHLEPAC